MKARIFFLILLVCFLYSLAPQFVKAHISGPPYVKINGIYAQTNPIFTYTSPTHIPMGTDLATASAYIVNDRITFEIDEQFFPNPYTYGTEKVTPLYRWDFGDGSPKQEGKAVTHVYTTSGTYLPNLEAKFPGKVEDYAAINPMQINILPYAGYVLPVARIKINKKLITDPTKDIIDVRKNSTIVFDASSSTGDIVSYEWDFSDETTGKGKTMSHAYKHSDYFPMFPILRVTDKNNIVHDTFVFLDSPQSNNIIINFIGWLLDMGTSITSIFRKN